MQGAILNYKIFDDLMFIFSVIVFSLYFCKSQNQLTLIFFISNIYINFPFLYSIFLFFYFYRIKKNKTTPL